jgi:Asp-tRNA(Asn)/Glu-tRNA(Gln) amidotransferase A subunit family amidase
VVPNALQVETLKVWEYMTDSTEVRRNVDGAQPVAAGYADVVLLPVASASLATFPVPTGISCLPLGVSVVPRRFSETSALDLGESVAPDALRSTSGPLPATTARLPQ